MVSTVDNILIIGGPNAGKTHFGGQLYGRLNSRQFSYKIAPNNRPADLTIFEEVLNRLSEGKRAGHTEASANRSIELKTDDSYGNEVIFSFPDYAGEQVKMIVADRKLDAIWKNYIDKSSSWVLFVRLDDVEVIEDIINRGIPDPQEISKRQSKTPLAKMSDASHLVELLQMLLYMKKVPTLRKIGKPKLTIILSCWDVLDLNEGEIPSNQLKERMPLLYEYSKNNWEENSLSIIGVSSTEKTLSDDPDEEYIDKSPIEFGYIIDEQGKKEKDLTMSIGIFLGKE